MGDAMSLDHYVSQVHLRNFYSPATSRLFGVKKSDLKTFPCRSEDVCRIDDGSTNAYLTQERAIEDLLLCIEPKYNAALAKLRKGPPDPDCIFVLAGFAAYVSCCAPAAMRIGTPPLQAVLEREAKKLEAAGEIDRAPPELGGKTLTELLADGTVKFKIDPKYPQALGITGIVERMWIWGNSAWEVLRISDPDLAFCTSDFPVAIEVRPDYSSNRIVPLAPDIALRIMPDNRLRGVRQDLSFKLTSCRFRTLGRAEVVEVNRAFVRCAEDLVFFRDREDWTKDFVSKHRHFRVETAIERHQVGNRVFTEAVQRLVERRPAEAEVALATDD
jgi:Protein of unknown function (DUF4238)